MVWVHQNLGKRNFKTILNYMKLMTVLILISVEECDCHKKDNQMNIHYIYVYCGRAGRPSVCKWNRFIILFN